MKRLLFLLLFAGCCGNQCSAESVVIATTSVSPRGGMVEENGTAVCIYSNDRGSILVTCKHVVETNPRSVWIRHANDWHQCGEIRFHPTEDIAIAETDVQLDATPLSDGIANGSDVLVEGAGPALAKTNEAASFRGRVTAYGIVGDDGLAVIPGDSGGPVYVQTASGTRAVGGITYGYPGDHKCLRRADHRGRGAVTLYTPCIAFTPWIEAQYGCGPQGCPIQIRRQVVVPVGPLGFQRGPARVIGVAEPVPQQYVPIPRGPQGPKGDPGMSVTGPQVEAIVNAWLDSNIDQLRGPQGPPGRDGAASNTAEFEARLSTLERRPFRMILASEGKVIDDESYEPGQPVVLDLKRLRSVSDAK